MGINKFLILKIMTFGIILTMAMTNIFADTAEKNKEIMDTLETNTQLEPKDHLPATTHTEKSPTPTKNISQNKNIISDHKMAKKAKMVIEKNAPELRKPDNIADTKKLQTALLVVSSRGDIKTMKYLIKTQNLDINQAGEYGMTPLLAATKAGQTKTVKFLIKKGANIQDTSENGIDALRFAVETKNYKLAKLFFKKGVNPDNQDYLGGTALMVAIKQENEKMIKLLTKHLKNLRLNLKNRDGKTILIMAAKNNNYALVKKLIKANANIWVLDNNGYDALSFAEKNNNKKTVELLKKEIAHARKNDPKVGQWVRKSGSIN
ncbi:MAG: ankyrin repeat domain-containing protein [bacterium]|nr:ankyrin repeat domain-containing protein [bacterium]